ncbi:MAG: baseplate J/gp47 family protein [Halanaerobiales bacterium]
MRVRGYRIFYIDREEGVNELINTIRKTPARKLALVVHNGILILNSAVNLKLIRKYADKYKKEIVFVNPDPLVISKAEENGFKIYPDLSALKIDTPFSAARDTAAGREDDKEKQNFDDTDSYEKSSKKDSNTKMKSKLSKIVALFILVLILGLSYLYFFYPTAVIEVQPMIQQARDQVEIQGNADIAKIDWDNKTIPLYLTNIELTDKETIETSGASLIGQTYASGKVKFINEKNQSINIPEGTVVSTDKGIKFKTTAKVVVPPLKIDYLMDVPVGMKAGQVEVEVKAVKKGSSGNLGVGEINKLNQKIDNVHVINSEPTTGGKDKRLSVVSDEDINRLKKLLEEKLKSKLITRVYQQHGGNYRLIEENIVFNEPEFKFDAVSGDSTDTLTAEAVITASGYLIKNSELDRLVTGIFKERMPNNVQLMSSGINISALKLEEISSSHYNIKIELLAPVIPIIDSAGITRKVMGLNLKKAEEILEGITEIEDYTIRSDSANMPEFGFAINVMIKEPEDMKVFKFNN